MYYISYVSFDLGKASAPAPFAPVPVAVPGDVSLVWGDEEYSMEERRAMLDRYKVRVY